MNDSTSRTSDASTSRLLIALTLASTLSPLNSTSMAVAIPAISGDLVTSAATLTQWLVTSYLVVGIVAQSPCGKLGDLFGHRRSLALGQFVFALGTIAGMVATHVWVVVLARVLMAAGGAAIVPSAVALVRDVVPAERRGRAYAAFGSAMGVAAAIGPVLGGELTSRFGWHSIFSANVPLLIASALLARGSVTERRPTERPSFDGVGSGLLGIGLAMVVIGAKAHVPLLAVAGLVALVAFALWERRVSAPVIDLRLFRNRAFAAASLVVTLQNLAMYALLFELPLFFSRVRALEANRSGRALLAMMASMVVVTPLGARLAERFGARRIASAGAVLTVVGMLLLRRGGAIFTPLDAALPLMILGAGMGLANAPAQAAAMGAVDPRDAGMAAGLYATMRYLGGIAGIAILGAVMTGRDAQTLLAQHALAVTLFAVSLVGALLCALLLPAERLMRASPPSE